MNKDIDFIKWMSEKAEGFNSISNYEDWENWENVFYPLLLQRAIEGVNRESEVWSIRQHLAITLYHGAVPSQRYDIEFHSIETAKESALRYIWEKENE